MFIITNREVNETKDDLDAFGSKMNPKGPNELRLAEAERAAGRWEIEILPDESKPASTLGKGITPKLNDKGELVVFGSQVVASRLRKRLAARRSNLVLFVHGFNNDMKAVLDRAEFFEKAYGVEALVFSWPANGGGLRGVASYLSDKRDALASTGALSRVLNKMADMLEEIHRPDVAAATAEAERRFGDVEVNNDERWNEVYARKMEASCRFNVNLVLHSMGNYLYKHMLQSSVTRIDRLIFDNVVLVAADTNNAGHAEWVDRIQCRNRVYITINEDDRALRASRMKAGEEQQARLGHYPFNLYSDRAMYVDFTKAQKVGNSHAYFEGSPIQNTRVRRFFEEAFNGLRAEERLAYEEARRLYRF